MKKNRIMTKIAGIAIMYAIFAATMGMAYVMNDIWALPFVRFLANGMTCVELWSKYLTTPWTAVIYAIEVFVMIPYMGICLANTWMEEQSKREAAIN